MQYWIDTEFDDSNGTLELISLGAFSSDDREFYAISSEFDPKQVKPWVRENVLPQLSTSPEENWMDLESMGEKFLSFVGPEKAEFWSLNPTYDWFLITWNFLGGWDNLPRNWPFECFDLGQFATHLGTEIPEFKMEKEHNALSDAKQHRNIYDFLKNIEATGN